MARNVRRLAWHYSLWLVGTALLVGALVGLLAWKRLQADEERHWAQLHGEAEARASLISARVATADGQLLSAKAYLEDLLARPMPAPPELEDKLAPAAAMPALALPSGTYLPADAVSPQGEGLALLAAAAPGKRPNATELAAGLHFIRRAAADMKANPLMDRGIFLMNGLSAGYPGLHGAELEDFLRAARQLDPLAIDRMLEEVAANWVRMTRDHGSGPSGGWLPPFRREPGGYVRLTRTAEVLVDGQRRGTIAIQFSAEQFVGGLTAPPGSRIQVVTSAGRLLSGRGDVGPGGAAPLLPEAEQSAFELAVRSGGEWVTIDDERLLALPVEGAPWHVLVIAPARTGLATAGLPGLAAVLALLAVAAAAAHVRFQRTFLHPAAMIVGVARAQQDAPPVGSMHPLWRPWATLIQESREEARRHVALLEEQNALTAAILDAALDCIVTTDGAGRIVEFNAAAEQTFGFRRDEVMGRGVVETLLPDGAPMAKGEWPGDLVGRRVELEGRRADGLVFPMEVTIAETLVAQRRLFVACMRDLTESRSAAAELAAQRQALHQSEKLAALGQMLAGLAHELNNPLSVVLGRAELLEEKLATTAHGASIRKLNEAANRCARIVRSFLATARPSAPDRTPVRINDLVEIALDLTQEGLSSAGILVETELAEGLPDQEVDDDSLVQLLVNLILNARHALEAQPTPRRLTLRTALDRSASSILIEVADNGPGIPEALAPRVFEPFFTTKPVGSGTGLGLAVSRNIAAAHQGTLELRATTGGGATFRLSLPVRLVQAFGEAA
jgi:PAS domain S-box-containing protein